MRRIRGIVAVVSAALVAPLAVVGSARANPKPGRVAYVYASDTIARDSFNSLLSGQGIGVDLVTVAAAPAFDFSKDVSIIIADDTGVGSTWGSSAALSNIVGSGRKFIAVGEGGSAFLGQVARNN